MKIVEEIGKEKNKRKDYEDEYGNEGEYEDEGN